MKRTDALTKLVSLLLFGALLAYLGVYIVHSLQGNLRTAPAVYVSLSENAIAAGLLVRSETLFDSSEKYLSVVPDSGQLVSKGETIAVIYSGEQALERAAKIRTLELQKAYIADALSGVDSEDSLSDKENAVKAAITKLAASAVRHEADSLASAAISLSSLVLKNTDIHTTQVDLNLITQQISALEQSALSDTVAITASEAGLFSASPDGYEYVTPDMLKGLDPAGLEALENAPQTLSDTVRGKMADPFSWYFAAVVSENDAAKLKAGGSAKLDFGRYCSRLLTADVVSLGGVSSGECVVVFRCTEATSEMLSVRRATAEIVFDAHEGIRVPKEAVLSDESGPYVYTLTGLQAEKKTISILWETDEYYLAAVTQEANGLRAGNDIILTTKGLYDGKVLKD